MKNWGETSWKTVASLSCLLAFVISSRAYSRTIYVDPVKGSNNESCLTNSSPENSCRNLSFVFEPQNRENSTLYILQPGIHYLDDAASKQPFTSLSDLAVIGNQTNGAVSVACSTDNAGLAFDNVVNVTLQNLTITECGAVQKSTSRNFSDLSNFSISLTRVALYFNYCKSLTIDSIYVTNSRNATGATVYNTIGENNFKNCIFSSNRGDPDSLYPAGGGLYIEFSYCLPGDDDCQNIPFPYYTGHNKNSTYSFDNCTFSDNVAVTAVNSTSKFILPHGRDHVAFGRGGGLSVFFNGDASDNQFSINDCTFSGNSAEYGGGLFVEYHDTSLGNQVVVQGNTNFDGNNTADVAGGGMRVAHYVFDRESAQTNVGNSVKILLSAQFTNNSAESGGGLSISHWLQNTTISERAFSVLIEKVNFLENHAPYGAALRIELFGLILFGIKPNINVSECNFIDNSVYPSSFSKPVEVGIGTLYASHIDVHINNTWFIDNHGTALALVGASAYFTGRMRFILNTGIDGGAIALLGSARIVIDDETHMFFDSNEANRGGAIYNIYADKNDYEHSPQCFIANVNPFLSPEDWGARFEFEYNSDTQGPNAIYSTSILPCFSSGGSSQQAVKTILCWSNWTYNGTNDCANHIRTGPGLIHSNHLVPINPNNTQDNNTVTAYSGQKIQLYYEALDDLGHPVTVAYAATVTNGTKPNHQGANLDPYYAYVTQDLLQVYQYKESSLKNVTVNLDEVGDRAWHIELNIVLKNCPPALQEVTVSCNSHDECFTCQCNSSAHYNNAVHCTNTSSASLANDYWIGLLYKTNGSETEYVTGVCPPGFCRNNRSVFSSLLPKNGSELNEFVCGPQNRTGTLCGRCASGYGLALNSDTHQCVLCNITGHQLALHATYYILAVYVPLFLLFLTIIIFNIKLTAGPANAFILFGQLISSTFEINRLIPLSTVLSHSDRYVLAYKFVYGLSNLEFLERFVPAQYMCLGTSLSVLDKMLLDFAVALSPLIMILVMVTAYKTNCCCVCRSCCRRRTPQRMVAPSSRFMASHRVPFGRVGDSVLPAIASFVLLSYNKFCLTASYLTVTQDLYKSDSRETGSSRVFYDGSYSSDNWTYILFYKLPAIFVFLTFVAIPPLLLFRYPLELLERKVIARLPSRIQGYYPKVRLHVLLDTFQGCFKNRYRGFAGLYFFFRIVININYILVSLAYQYMMQGIYCIILALLVAYFKPYRSKFHVFNYVDSIMFVNLAVINQISFYLYAVTLQGHTISLGAFVVQYILVFAPLVYMIGYLVWIVLPIPQVRERAREWLDARRFPQQMENLIQNNRDETSTVGDDVDWERARAVNRYRPHRSDPNDDNGPRHSSIASPLEQSTTNGTDSPSPSYSLVTNSIGGYGSTERSDSGITVVNSQTATTTTSTTAGSSSTS